VHHAQHSPLIARLLLSVVQTFNMQEVIEYAKLVSIRRPTFIEIKDVTFCGKVSKRLQTHDTDYEFACVGTLKRLLTRTLCVLTVRRPAEWRW
jgi:wyosine [tRNA(Phe)-imidazoG37] synthetase (radical SAM superfamily)